MTKGGDLHGHATDLISVNPQAFEYENHFWPYSEASDWPEGQEWECPEADIRLDDQERREGRWHVSVTVSLFAIFLGRSLRYNTNISQYHIKPRDSNDKIL